VNPNGSFTYTHNINPTGLVPVSFSYQVRDTGGLFSNIVFVNLTVNPVIVNVTVPNVVGQTQVLATPAITVLGLTVTTTSANSATVAVGTVISQNPLAGASVAPGSAVALVISLGPANVTVPNVVGQTQVLATPAITVLGLTVSTTSANSATVAVGSVISQNPLAGASVAPGTAVALVISLGPANVTVPDVVNQTQAAATAAITGLGLTAGISTANSPTILSGNVISQNPLANASVAPGSAVALVISLGPAVVLDPTQVLMVFVQGAGNRSIAVTTTTAGVRLVAFVGADGPSGANGQAATVSGGGLTWTRVQQQRARSGVAEIWTANAPAVLTNASITSTLSNAAFTQQLTVIGFTNVSAVGAFTGASTPGAAAVVASTSLVTQGAGSVVYAVGLDWASITARTVGAGQTKVREYLAPGLIASWVQRLNGVTGAAGSTVALTTTAPTSNQWNMAAVELLR
jgi:beta-lactam-binding protein with PASTA domain